MITRDFDEKVKKLGRTIRYTYEGAANGETALWLTYSATGIEFILREAKELKISLVSDNMVDAEDNWRHFPRYGAFVNGTEAAKECLTTHNGVLDLSKSLTGGVDVVRFIKLSECSDSSLGITAIESDGKIAPTAPKGMKIEIIGDSITCGYGVEEALGGEYRTSNENVTKSYSYRTAEALCADYSLVSISGYGIISGWTGDGNRRPDQLVPDYYKTMGFSYGEYVKDVKPSSLGWDFSAFQPDIVVINLGTNDESYTGTDTEKTQFFIEEYKKFVNEVHSLNPNASIICCLGLMGQLLLPAVERAVEELNAEGLEKIYYMPYEEDLTRDGYVVDYHPSYLAHTNGMEQLVGFIRGLR